MKRLLNTALFFLACTGLCNALEISLEPVRRNVTLGRFIQLTLTSDRNVTKIDYPALADARWQTNYSSTGIRNINGKVTHTKTLLIIPEKEGTLTIPPFKVHAGRESAMTPAVTLRILPRPAPGQGELSLAEAVRGRLTVTAPGGGSEVYAGEELTVDCDLLIDERVLSQIRPGHFPELTNTGNAVFTFFNYRGSRVKFRMAEPVEVLEKEQPFMRYRFTARCRVLTPGVFAPEATIQVGVVQRRSFADDMDDFFGSSFFGTNIVPHTVRFNKITPVTVKALPPVPAGAENTSLVGKWQLTGKLSGSSLRQGEVAELTLHFKGSGSAENFHAPEARFPGFRVYPPEVTAKNGEVTAKYALVPLEPGEKVITLKAAVFDPAGGRWIVHDLNFKTAVAKGVLPPTAGVQQNFAPAVSGKKVTDADAADTGTPQICYQKNTRGKKVLLPLISNRLGWIIFFAAGFPLLALVIEFFFRRREKELNTPEFRQRKALKNAVKALEKELRSQGDTPGFRAKLIPLLGEAMGLTAGATPGEIAGKIADPELCCYFAGLDSAGFVPGEAEKVTLSPAGKKALRALLKKFALVLLLFCLSSPAAGSSLNASFNRGDFAKAAAEYRSLMGDSRGFYPNMLYNYGNCQYHLNNLPQARWALNLASLLDPGDGEIRANLHLVNARLFQNGEEQGSFSGALKEMRDRIRCDTFLLLGAFFWGLIWLLWSFRRKLGPTLFYGFSGAAFCLALLCFISFAAQLNGICSPRNITVTAKSVELRTLPGLTAGTTETTLTGGGTGELLQEDNSGYCLIRINGREGWVPATAISRTLPGGVL